MSLTKPSISVFRKLVYTSLILILLFLCAEIITAVFYYHQYGKRKLALVELYHTISNNQKVKEGAKESKEKNHRFQQLVRPESSTQMNQKIHDESIQANKFVYAPWVEFRNMDYNGKYINTNGFTRTSVQHSLAGIKDTLTIWFFGGSTMYGFNVADEETIPSAFAASYYKYTKTAKNLRVVNYGIPYYYSYQEYKLFQLMLDQNPAPDLVIFLDGLNDFYNRGNSYALQSIFSNTLSDFMLKENNYNLSQHLKHTNLLSEKTLSVSGCDSLITSFLNNHRLIEKQASFVNSRTLFIIQPVPFYNYPKQATDPICSKVNNPEFYIIYPKLQTICRNKQNCLYLGDLLLSFNKLAFVDAFHYSPSFNKYIAEVILKHLKL